jgi:hypothetical protein
VLQRLNDDPAWRQLYGRKSKRLKDMELVLRFFAFLYYSEQYKSPMKDFLNRYMATNRRLQKQSEDVLRTIFTKTTRTMLDGIGKKALRPKRAVNAAVADSVMTGIAKRIQLTGKINNLSELKRRFDRLMADKKYIAATESGTAQEASVSDRLSKAESAFDHLS